MGFAEPKTPLFRLFMPVLSGSNALVFIFAPDETSCMGKSAFCTSISSFLSFKRRFEPRADRMIFFAWRSRSVKASLASEANLRTLSAVSSQLSTRLLYHYQRYQILAYYSPGLSVHNAFLSHGLVP